MKHTTLAVLAVLAIATLATGCKKKSSEPTHEAPGSGTVKIDAPEAPPIPDAGSAAAAPAGTTSLKDGFQAPESAYYDAADDRILVSNINGGTTDADDNGFILAVNPEDGKVTKLLDGASPDIKLDAPKGLVVSGDTLYVADITVVRRFDPKSGKQKDDIKIPGAAFLNDVAADTEGGVYVTDTGADGKRDGADAIYHVGKDGKVKPVIKDKTLGGPNGILPGDAGALWVVTLRSGELFSVDASGKKGTPEKLPKGGLDGILALEGGDLLISSWEGKAVYRGKPGGPWTAVVSEVPSPADIGYDSKRKRLLIPVLEGNELRVVPLP